MQKNSMQRLIDGYHRFQKKYLEHSNDAYRLLASKGQQPHVMVIACSDSRINPAILTQSNLGDIFTVNNVANLVPPYKEGQDTHHSTSSALEFALHNLPIEHIIILGHSGCGGIQALMSSVERSRPVQGYSFINQWISIASAAKERVLQQIPEGTQKQRQDLCEREALLTSLDNLQGFPWVQEALEKKSLQIHAWHFDIPSGTIEYYNAKEKQFLPLT